MASIRFIQSSERRNHALGRRQIEEKTYEQYMDEVVGKISMYAPEWTNFNPSDPGITTLENITALNVLQESYINKKHHEGRTALMKLAGFLPKEGSAARVYLSAKNNQDTIILPEGQQFRIGDLPFECEKTTVVSKGKLINVVANNKDFSELLEKQNIYSCSVFSDKPEKNMEFNLIFDEIQSIDKQFSIYVDLQTEFNRNNPGEGNKMVSLHWQCYTEKGFQNISVKDETWGFLYSGIIRFDLGDNQLIKCDVGKHSGYVIRAVLDKPDYDIPPKLNYIEGPLFEVVQQENLSFVKEYVDGLDEIAVYSDILENEYTRIYSWQEEKNCYTLCNEDRYHIEHDGYGMFRYQFDGGCKKVMIAAYSDSLMPLCKIGVIEGYDNQYMELPFKGQLVTNCSVIIERTGKNGENEYFHMLPDMPGNEGFRYHIDRKNGKIYIDDGGRFHGSTVYVGQFAISRGIEGNIPPEKEFTPVGYESDIIFTNPVAGFDGCDFESVNEVEHRFLQDVNNSYTAVRAQDYVDAVMATPFLCIDKVNAYRKSDDNIIHIAVKPQSAKNHPSLPGLYKQMIMDNLDKRRIMGSIIRLQSPVYTPVNVYGKISVKEHYVDADKIIDNTIRELVDFAHMDKAFGAALHFDVIFQKLERLECVESIGELTLRPSSLAHVTVDGVDLIADGNCLFYPGEIKIDTHMVHH